MIDYYIKMFNDHPLIEYVEDAFAQFDFNNHKAFSDKLQNELPRVNMGLKTIFAANTMQRIR